MKCLKNIFTVTKNRNWICNIQINRPKLEGRTKHGGMEGQRGVLQCQLTPHPLKLVKNEHTRGTLSQISFSSKSPLTLNSCAVSLDTALLYTCEEELGLKQP